MAWYHLFVPDRVITNYLELTEAFLSEFNCRLLVMDLDNTLVAYNVERADDNVKGFIDYTKQAGYQIAIVSNNSKDRVSLFVADLDVKYYAKACKPLPGVYKRIMKDFGCKMDEIVFVGDQLLTDVLGAKLVKGKVIWSKPLVEKDLFVTKFNRRWERMIYRLLLKKGLISDEV